MNKRFLGGLAALSASLVPMLSHAAAAEAFTTAITSTTADVGTYGAALVGVGAVGVGFMIAIKYIKKIRGAA
ncbi:hypothetical protein [Variovorax saccharolyticus]|uniref:hypothetical protein n=1 Tax=Variovorax saccharolyticus TaxID=3053516 RepID=UPI002578A68C|nr:hypothetical protein [Variovorax sp. J31P216]MDM0027770.1 hypothetical protein [Variovorax sp. J31P216]